MDEREALIADLERQDLIAQLTAMDAAPPPEPEGPSGMDMMAQFGRGAVPFANEVRGGLDASMTKLFGDDPASWGELQDLYAGDQVEGEAQINEQSPGLAKALEAGGFATSMLIPAGGMIKAGDKAADAQKLAARAAKPRLTVPATAHPIPKPRVRVEAGTRKIREPFYSVRVPAIADEVAVVAAPVTASGGLQSATGLLKRGAEHAAVIGGATAIGGPLAGAGAAVLRTKWGKEKLAKELAKYLRSLK